MQSQDYNKEKAEDGKIKGEMIGLEAASRDPQTGEKGLPNV